MLRTVLILAGAGVAVSLACATTGDLKTGHVDVERALSSSTAGKAARRDFARMQSEARAEIEPMIDRYQELEEELEQKKSVLSDEALLQRKHDLARMRDQIQSAMEELEGQLLAERNRIEGMLFPKLTKIIETIGNEEQFDLIVNAETGGWLYRRSGLSDTASAGKRAGVDLTKRVARELDSMNAGP